jgi:hypothetical protein
MSAGLAFFFLRMIYPASFFSHLILALARQKPLVGAAVRVTTKWAGFVCHSSSPCFVRQSKGICDRPSNHTDVAVSWVSSPGFRFNGLTKKEMEKIFAKIEWKDIIQAKNPQQDSIISNPQEVQP